MKGNDHLPPMLEKAPIKKALEIMDHLGLNEQERSVYENRMKFLRMEESALLKQRREGFEMGIESGIRQGMEKDIEQGIENEKLNIARIMFAEGENVEKIHRITGLSIEMLRVLSSS